MAYAKLNCRNDTTQQNTSQQINGIFKGRELPEQTTHNRFLLGQKDAGGEADN